MANVVASHRFAILFRKTFNHPAKSVDRFDANLALSRFRIYDERVTDHDEAASCHYPLVICIDRDETVATVCRQDDAVIERRLAMFQPVLSLYGQLIESDLVS